MVIGCEVGPERARCNPAAGGALQMVEALRVKSKTWPVELTLQVYPPLWTDPTDPGSSNMPRIYAPSHRKALQQADPAKHMSTMASLAQQPMAQAVPSIAQVAAEPAVPLSHLSISSTPTAGKSPTWLPAPQPTPTTVCSLGGLRSPRCGINHGCAPQAPPPLVPRGTPAATAPPVALAVDPAAETYRAAAALVDSAFAGLDASAEEMPPSSTAARPSSAGNGVTPASAPVLEILPVEGGSPAGAGGRTAIASATTDASAAAVVVLAVPANGMEPVGQRIDMSESHAASERGGAPPLLTARPGVPAVVSWECDAPTRIFRGPTWLLGGAG
jgi:hypothetical protein